MKTLVSKGFSGVDERILLTDSPVSASYMRNFRVTDDRSLCKRPSRKPVWYAADEIDCIWHGKLQGESRTISAAGGKLISVDISNGDSTILAQIGAGKCVMFGFMGSLYILTNDFYGKYDGSTLDLIEGYAPLAAVSCTASGSGTLFEQLNMLTPLRRKSYSCDGSSLTYNLAEENILVVSSVTLDGEPCGISYVSDEAAGTVTFASAPPEGLNNLVITYAKGQNGRERILGCRNAMLFGGNSDGRIFLWGNPAFPNYRFHSELASGEASAEYFPVNNYTVIGDSEITCIVQQYDRQLIFTREQAFYSYCELKEDSLGNYYSSFPVFNLNGSKGCLMNTDGCMLGNTPVTLCDDGLNRWESTSIENEKNATVFSREIDVTLRSLLARNEMDSARLFAFQAEGEMYFTCGGYAIVYNYGNGCFYVFDSFGCTHYCVSGETLFMTNGETLYTMSESGGSDYESGSCVWRSSLISPDESGSSDMLGITADVELNGPLTLTFSCRGGSTDDTEETSFDYSYLVEREQCRLYFRPRLKRKLPIQLEIDASGTGSCVIKQLTMKIKNRERNSKNGIR